MKITVQSIHFTADKGLLEFIQKKQTSWRLFMTILLTAKFI